jgi:hypothetical protein
MSSRCPFCTDAYELFPDMLSLTSHLQRCHSEMTFPRSVTTFPRSDASLATTGATSSSEEARKPAPRSMAMNDVPCQSSLFPELNGFSRVFIVQFNMSGSDMSVEQVAALSDEGLLKLTAHVPSQLYLTSHARKTFKSNLPGGKEMTAMELDVAHAMRILSKFFILKEDVAAKIPQFIREKKSLKVAIARCIRATMQQALLSKVRLANDGMYQSIASWNELMAECAKKSELHSTVADLFSVSVYSSVPFTEYQRSVLASDITKSCGFVFNDANANKDFITLHVTEVWSEISQKIRKTKSKDCSVSAGTSYCFCFCLCILPITLSSPEGNADHVCERIRPSGHQFLSFYLAFWFWQHQCDDEYQ